MRPTDAGPRDSARDGADGSASDTTLADLPGDDLPASGLSVVWADPRARSLHRFSQGAHTLLHHEKPAARRLLLDELGKKIYWGGLGIFRADYDGKNAEQVFFDGQRYVWDLALDPDTGTLYFIDGELNVRRVTSKTQSVVLVQNPRPKALEAGALAWDRKAKKLYFSLMDAHPHPDAAIYRFDGATATPIPTLELVLPPQGGSGKAGGDPTVLNSGYAIAIDSSRERYYVADRFFTIKTGSTANLGATKSKLGSSPRYDDIALDANGDALYALRSGAQLLRFDNASAASSVGVSVQYPGFVGGVAIELEDADKRLFWIDDAGAIRGATQSGGLAQVLVSASSFAPTAICYLPQQSAYYVANGDAILALKGGGGFKPQLTGQGQIEDLYCDATTNTLYWSDSLRQQISSVGFDPAGDVDPTTQITVVDTLGFAPGGIELDPGRGLLFWTRAATSTADNTVYRRSLAAGSTIVSFVVAGGLNPTDLALDTVGGRVYTLGFYERGAIVSADYDGSNQAKVYETGCAAPGGIAYSAARSELWWVGCGRLYMASKTATTPTLLVETGRARPRYLSLIE